MEESNQMFVGMGYVREMKAKLNGNGSEKDAFALRLVERDIGGVGGVEMREITEVEARKVVKGQ